MKRFSSAEAFHSAEDFLLSSTCFTVSISSIGSSSGGAVAPMKGALSVRRMPF
jgi:hypothetical protein